jgi:hypothetical protein
MPIKFTKHALQRMKVRNISKDDIIEAINNPDNELNDSFGNKIAHKVKNNYLLRIFYYLEGNSKIIITAYKTSKIDKYIRK